MARLQSEDMEYPSSFQIARSEELNIGGQRWDRLILRLTQGSTTLSLGGSETKDDPQDSVILCREPTDEAKALVDNLQKVLDGIIEETLFEPSEPSFEINVRRSGTPTQGFRIHIWFDSGNVETGIYRWDSLGLRFFTTDTRLRGFIQDLKDEFAC